MPYNPKYNAQNYKYRREKFKVIAVEVERPYYEEVLKPAAEKEGIAVGSYIKEAISEKIARESPQNAITEKMSRDSDNMGNVV